MDENKFWLGVWVIVATGVCVIAITIAVSVYTSSKLIADADDPVAAACALDSGYGKACIAYLGAME